MLNNYGADGNITTGFIVAKHAEDENGSRHFVLVKSGKAFDPVNAKEKDKSSLKLRFVSVKPDMFDLYMLYLKNKEPRFLREVNRNLVDG